MVVSKMISIILFLSMLSFAHAQDSGTQNNKSNNNTQTLPQIKTVNDMTTEEFLASLGLVNDIERDPSDKNENGIRDDVDLYLSLTVKTPSKEADLSYLYAVYLQHLLTNNSTQADDLFFPFLNTLYARICLEDDSTLDDIEILMTDSFEVWDRILDVQSTVLDSRYRYWLQNLSCYYAEEENVNKLPYHEFVESKKIQIIEQARQYGIRVSIEQGIYDSITSKFEP